MTKNLFKKIAASAMAATSTGATLAQSLMTINADSVTAQDVANAQATVSDAQTAVSNAQEKVNTASSNVADLQNQYNEAQNAVTAAQQALDDAIANPVTEEDVANAQAASCLLYTSPSPRDS